MSANDNSFSIDQKSARLAKSSLKERWWYIMDNWKIGIIPLPLFVLAGVLIGIECLYGELPSDIVVMVATLAFLALPVVSLASVYR